jgi:hypothetical protein
VSVEAQQRALRPSTVSMRVDPHQRRFVGTTSNVERMSIDLTPLLPGDPITVDVDGQKLDGVAWPASKRVWLERVDDKWRVAEESSPDVKNPLRCGPFKDAFRNRMVFVYGTGGTPQENAWAVAKARFDAETFWYRGNGSVEVVADRDFKASTEPDRNVIVYGNADTVSCWSQLLGKSPVQVKRGEVRVSSQTYAGDDMACLFLRPRRNSDRACVAVIGGSGIVGMRVTDRLPIFLSGVAYPDYTVLAPQVFERGLDGVRCGGFFGNDWSVERGECASASE